MARIFVEFFGANSNQVIHVQCLPVNRRSVPQSGLRREYLTLGAFTRSVRSLYEICLPIFLRGLVQRWLTGAQSLAPLRLKSFLLVLVAALHLVLLHLVYHMLLLKCSLHLLSVVHRRVGLNVDVQWVWVLRNVSTKIPVFLFLLATGVLCPFIIELFSVAPGPNLLGLAPIGGPLGHLVLPL